jgi:hypothetical protein
MGYYGGVEAVEEKLFKTLPINIGMITDSTGVEFSVYKATLDFSNVTTLIVATRHIFGAGANSLLKVDIGGVNKVTYNTGATTSLSTKIDCSAITGAQILEIKADVAAFTNYFENTSLSVVE